MDRSQLLQRLNRAWRDLLDAYAGLPDAELLRPGAHGGWSVRDVIAHVSVWEQEALTHLPLILAGGRPSRYSVTYGGIDAFNALTTDRDRALTLAAVLQRRDRIHRRLVAYLKEAPAEQIARETRFRRRLRLDTYGHYTLHAAAIRRWRAEMIPGTARRAER